VFFEPLLYKKIRGIARNAGGRRSQLCLCMELIGRGQSTDKARRKQHGSPTCLHAQVDAYPVLIRVSLSGD
jgi:hypothetical protein